MLVTAANFYLSLRVCVGIAEAETEVGEAMQHGPGHRGGSGKAVWGSVFPTPLASDGRLEQLSLGARRHCPSVGLHTQPFLDPFSALHPFLSWTWAGLYPFVEEMALKSA